MNKQHKEFKVVQLSAPMLRSSNFSGEIVSATPMTWTIASIQYGGKFKIMRVKEWLSNKNMLSEYAVKKIDQSFYTTVSVGPTIPAICSTPDHGDSGAAMIGSVFGG